MNVNIVHYIYSKIQKKISDVYLKCYVYPKMMK